MKCFDTIEALCYENSAYSVVLKCGRESVRAQYNGEKRTVLRKVLASKCCYQKF